MMHRTVSVLLTLLFSHFLAVSPLPLPLHFLAIPPLSIDYVFVNLQCKHSLPAHSLLIYSPSVLTGPFDAGCPWGSQNHRGS